MALPISSFVLLSKSVLNSPFLSLHSSISLSLSSSSSSLSFSASRFSSLRELKCGAGDSEEVEELWKLYTPFNPKMYDGKNKIPSFKKVIYVKLRLKVDLRYGGVLYQSIADYLNLSAQLFKEGYELPSLDFLPFKEGRDFEEVRRVSLYLKNQLSTIVLECKEEESKPPLPKKKKKKQTGMERERLHQQPWSSFINTRAVNGSKST